MEITTDINQKPFKFNKTQLDYLQTQMNRVSRSFAVVVDPLEGPLKGYLSIAYLICRVADNIEDCRESYDWKEKRFDEFKSLLTDPSNALQVLSPWGLYRWPGLSPSEKMMMGSSVGGKLWKIYTAIPRAKRVIIQRWASRMADGMMRLEDPEYDPLFLDHQGIRVLSKEADYDEYCFIVAGTVGHMATELVIDTYNLNGDVSHNLLETSEACGRALQKTNILKDFRNDLGRGICYLPDEWLREVAYSPLSLEGVPAAWKQMVIKNILDELHTATEYVTSLPLELETYRQSTLLCLLPALQTNLLAAKENGTLFTSDHQYKISRLTMGKCIPTAQQLARDNYQIATYSEKLQREIKQLLHTQNGR